MLIILDLCLHFFDGIAEIAWILFLFAEGVLDVLDSQKALLDDLEVMG